MMKEYAVYENSDGVIIAIKNGFSWPGYFITWIWCLVKKYPNAGKEWGWQYIFPGSELSIDPRCPVDLLMT